MTRRRFLARAAATSAIVASAASGLPLASCAESPPPAPDAIAASRFQATSRRSAGRGRGKVFVVLEAELMSAPAQNALLKTLEEPPPGVTLILIAE